MPDNEAITPLAGTAGSCGAACACAVAGDTRSDVEARRQWPETVRKERLCHSIAKAGSFYHVRLIYMYSSLFRSKQTI